MYLKYLEEEYRYSSTRAVKPEQFKASPQEWNDSRIAVSLDSIKDKLIWSRCRKSGKRRVINLCNL